MEQKKEFIINVIYIGLICALVYFGVNFLLGLLLPFIMGFLFAYIAKKISSKFFKDNSKLHRGITLALLYIFIILLISLLVALGVNKIGDFVKNLPTFYKNAIEPFISNIEQSLYGIGNNLPSNISSYLNGITDGIFDALRSVLSVVASALVNATTNLITNIPSFFVSLLITIITSFYIIFDYEGIANWFIRNLPHNVLDVLYEIKDFCENVLFKMLGSYATILGITFIELCIGLTVLGVNNSPMWAFLIAFLDILPVLGVGTVLIPWGIGSLLTGNVLLGIELLVLYIIITVVRQVIEPKFVGTNLDLHPLATLVSMIVGLRLLGAVGMFGFPLTLSFLLSRSKKSQ